MIWGRCAVLCRQSSELQAAAPGDEAWGSGTSSSRRSGSSDGGSGSVSNSTSSGSGGRGGGSSGSTKSVADTLVMYVYADSDPEYRRNLEFFVRFGVSDNDGCEYVIVIQQVYKFL